VNWLHRSFFTFQSPKMYVNTTFRRLLSAESVMRLSAGRVHLPSAKPRERPRKVSKTSSTLPMIPLRNRGPVLCAHFTMSQLCCSVQHVLLSVPSTRLGLRVNHVLLPDHRGHRIVLPDQSPMYKNSLVSLQGGSQAMPRVPYIRLANQLRPQLRVDNGLVRSARSSTTDKHINVPCV
jgi:hypothetical protein